MKDVVGATTFMNEPMHDVFARSATKCVEDVVPWHEHEEFHNSAQMLLWLLRQCMRQNSTLTHLHCALSMDQAAQLDIELVVDRVPTNDNIAELPSRGKYQLLHKIGAEAVEAKLDAAFCKPTAWEALALPNGFC